MENMKSPVVGVTQIGVDHPGEEPLDRLSVTVRAYQKKHDYGFSAEVRVWIPRRDATLSELKKDAILEAKEFLEAALAACG